MQHRPGELHRAQTEDQRAIAPIAVAQTQTGPVRCCSFQGVNPADTCTMTQVGKQSGNANAVQTESISARAGTVRHVHAPLPR